MKSKDDSPDGGAPGVDWPEGADEGIPGDESIGSEGGAWSGNDRGSGISTSFRVVRVSP